MIVGVKMHADEVDIDAALVARLLTGQFPDWAGLPIEPVASSGTDNAMFRLGPDLVVRRVGVYIYLACSRCCGPSC